MLTRLIGIAIGGLVTFLLLLRLVGGRIITDTNTAYLVAILGGAIVDFAWPVVIGARAAKRAKARRDDEIQAEVERQVDAQQHGG